MDLDKHVLPRDLEAASRALTRLKIRLQCITDNVEKGNVDLAQHHSMYMIRSLQELIKLAERRKVFERHKHLLNSMPVEIHMELVGMMQDE